MAKSLRSKWRRKCRAVKRVRYGEKELIRLKKTLGIDGDDKVTDEVMADASDIVKVVNVKRIKEKKEEGGEKEGETMETNEQKRIFNPKTMKDQHGTFPVWMNQRKIRKSKKGKIAKKATKSKGKSKKK